MKLFTIALIALLFMVHQDFWWWDDSTVVHGFLPVGLASQMVITLGAGIGWWLATEYCWPKQLDDSPIDESKKESER